MEKKSILFNKKTFTVHDGTGGQTDDDIILITNDEILSSLPEIIQNDILASCIRDCIIKAIKNLSGIEIPMTGTARFGIGLATKDEASVIELTQVHNFLLSETSELAVNVRSYNCIKAAGIKKVYHLAMQEPEDLLKFRNFGNKSLKEIEGVLEESGITQGIKRQLREKDLNIRHTLLRDVPSIYSTETFKVLHGIVLLKKDLSRIGIGEFEYFDRHMFPYRTDDDDYKETEYEEAFKSDTRKKIEELFPEVRKLIRGYWSEEMENFVRRMKIDQN